MEYKNLGNTGIKVSSLCMGTMTFGTESDKKASAEIFNHCREVGINFFDCADVYSGGEAERILGKLIAPCREEIILTSKCGFSTGREINAQGASRRHIVSAVEASLKRLNTDYIDLYFIHHFDDNTPLEETLRALDDLVTQGKILYTGASNFSAWQVSKALGISNKEGWNRFSCIQPMYNLIKRQAEVEILPMALSENLAVTTYSPIAGGVLTGKYKTGKRLSGGRLSQREIYKKRYWSEENFEVSMDFQRLAKKRSISPAGLAVAWVASHPAVTAPIIGARNVEQLKQTLQALKLTMTYELYAEISSFTPNPPPSTDRSEEGML